jgi:hypothetical protein
MNNAALLIFTALLTIAAMIIGFFFGSEIVRVLRDLFSPPAQRGLYSLDSDDRTDTTARASDRTRRNRATVERMITHFEEKDTRSVPGSKE